jgi:S-formylglutathione hydrolase
MATIELTKKAKCFGGRVEYYTHASVATKTPMTFSVFIPESAAAKAHKPAMIWLSGLTCTEENFITKAGVFPWASEHGITVICPDTSPRGTDLPGEHDSYDFGSGAGFYLNATAQPWSENYHMYDYVVNEITDILYSNFSISKDNLAISGHSMGGHGALIMALKNRDTFKSVSAFSPIVNPMNCPWGQKAFSLYLGENKADWEQYDSLMLVEKSESIPPMFIDQGLADDFLAEQLKTEVFANKIKDKGFSDHCTIRMQEGYDHSYFFITSFIKDHMDFHASHICRD